MKHLRETFTDEEFEELLKAKRKSCMNWHDFLLHCAMTELYDRFEYP